MFSLEKLFNCYGHNMQFKSYDLQNLPFVVISNENMGPVVQSIVSLTSLLVVKLLTVLVSAISNSQVFLLNKMWVAFALFSAKILAYMHIFNNQSFNDKLSNNIVSLSNWALFYMTWSFIEDPLYISVSIQGLYRTLWMRVRLETRRLRVRIPPRSATFFRGDWSWNIFYGHAFPSADSRRAVVSADSRRAVVSSWRKNVHNTGEPLRGLSLLSKRVAR